MRLVIVDVTVKSNGTTLLANSEANGGARCFLAVVYFLHFKECMLGATAKAARELWAASWCFAIQPEKFKPSSLLSMASAISPPIHLEAGSCHLGSHSRMN